MKKLVHTFEKMASMTIICVFNSWCLIHQLGWTRLLEILGRPFEKIGKHFENIGKPFEKIGEPFEKIGKIIS